MGDPTSGATNTRIQVAIIGAGVIGTSVAFACAKAGHPVVLIDRADQDWAAVRRNLRQHQRRLRFSKSSAPKVDIDKIVFSHDLADVEDAQLIVENVTELLDTKLDLYRLLGTLDIGDATIAVNTSAIPIARLASAAPDPSRVIGVHFMNPVDQIDTVEIVRGPATSEQTLATVAAFLANMNKSGIIVNDLPGFVINRILMTMINQAARLQAEGVATAFEIDTLFKGCLGHSMGPLRTADLIGIDAIVNTLHVLDDLCDEPIFKPAKVLLAMIRNNQLGMKTGRGFYVYDTETSSG